MRLVILIIPRTATSRLQNLVMTGERALITWWQNIEPHTIVFPTNSQPEFKLKITLCHNKSLNHKTWQHTFRPTTQCQNLNRLHRDKIQIWATLWTNLPKQLQVSRLNNNPRRHHFYWSQQQRTHKCLMGKMRNLNCLKIFFRGCLKCNLRCQKRWKLTILSRKSTTNKWKTECQQQTDARRRTHHFQTKVRQTKITSLSETLLA